MLDAINMGKAKTSKTRCTKYVSALCRPIVTRGHFSCMVLTWA